MLKQQAAYLRSQGMDGRADYLERRARDMNEPTMSSLKEREFALKKEEANQKKRATRQTLERLPEEFWKAKNHRNLNGIRTELQDLDGFKDVYLSGDNLVIAFDDKAPQEINLTEEGSDKAFFAIVQKFSPALKNTTYNDYEQANKGWRPSEEDNYQVRLETQQVDDAITNLLNQGNAWIKNEQGVFVPSIDSNLDKGLLEKSNEMLNNVTFSFAVDQEIQNKCTLIQISD